MRPGEQSDFQKIPAICGSTECHKVALLAVNAGSGFTVSRRASLRRLVGTSGVKARKFIDLII